MWSVTEKIRIKFYEERKLEGMTDLFPPSIEHWIGEPKIKIRTLRLKIYKY